MTVIALVGPTATGKSHIALAAAPRLDAEIVAVDAFTLYRGMDIGTAKPAAAARAAVPHHMVDVLDPSQEGTVAWFQQRAREAIADVLVRGRTALLVGGSGLYFRAVVDDLRFPPTDPAVRAVLEERFADQPAAAHAALAQVDPDAAARMDPGNLRRAIRALEVLELTGERFSTFSLAWDEYRSIYPNLVVVGVQVDRGALRQRAQRRVATMLAEGWLDEVRALASSELGPTARQAIGYQELAEHLAGGCSLDEARERTTTRTRRYAAAQQRWFAADPRIRWAAPSDALEVLCSS